MRVVRRRQGLGQQEEPANLLARAPGDAGIWGYHLVIVAGNGKLCAIAQSRQSGAYHLQ